MNPSYQRVVADALEVAQATVDEGSRVEAVSEWEDRAEVLISKNEEGGFLSVAMTLVTPADEDAADELLEQLLRKGSDTALGDVLVGTCRPDRQLMLAALIPLELADEVEIDRRVAQLAGTIAQLEQEAASYGEVGAAYETNAVPEGADLGAVAGWMRM